MFNKNFSKEPTEKQKLGKMGEDFACQYLENNGYKTVERNYLKKWGEIDIISKKANKIHFIEVKSVSREMSGGVYPRTNLGYTCNEQQKKELVRGLIHETNDSYRAEDNMHPRKLQRLGRAIQSYLLDRDIPDSMDWQFDVATVYIDQSRGLHKVFLLEDVVL